MFEGLKNKMVSMYDKTGLPSIAYGKILNEEKDDKGNLKTLAQQELDKYNTAYNNDINSVPLEMSMNNMEGVKEYQASMLVYYTKKAGLEKEIQDTQKKLEEAKKQGNLQEQQQLEAKLNWLNKDVKFLDQSKEMAKKVLHFSNFTARKYDELLSMSTELVKAQSVYRNLVGTSFGNQGSQMQTAYDSLNASRDLFNKVGRMNFNNQITSAYIQDPNGNKLMTITGKNDYNKVNMSDYNAIQDRIDYYRKNNINEKDNISIEDLQEQAIMVSSLIAEQYNMKQQELGFMQQEKQLQIDITKYYLERNKLIANFTESAETKQSDIDIKSANINYSMRYGGGKYNSIEELQRVTNLKLENSNLKMKDQLDYAKRQIMVAKENSTRQINAIRRLESKNTSNSQKSDTQAKQNSNETNRTIVESANTISNNLNTALSQIMNSLQSMQTSYSPLDSPSVPQGYNPEADKWTKFWQVYNLAMQSGDPHPMVTAGQWALESGWGSKESGKNNLFGVKGTSGTRKMGYEGSMATFRDYNSPLESVKDHVNLKLNGSNFKNLGYANSGSDEEALRRIASMYVDGTKSAGRFTDDYIKNITNIMKMFKFINL